MTVGPGQVYQDGAGNYLLFAYHETREGVEGDVFLGVRHRRSYTRFFPTNTVIAAELVIDTAGRKEADAHAMYATQVERERDALAECMKEAARKLAGSDVEELRALYAKRTTKP